MKKIIMFFCLLIPINVYGISASSYIVMDTDNNRVLEGNNIHKESLIASITKIMTSMVVINNEKDLNKIITIDNNVLKSYGSGIYVEVGEKISILNLLYGLMLRSGNDAAIALSFYSGGSNEGFIQMMNDLARSLNMKNTKFINPHGLENGNDANTSTVYDMALLSSYAIKNDKYKKIVGTKTITVKTDKKTYIWHNKNKLLNMYEFTTGGKTGFTKKARRTLVTNASKDNINLTIVTFNDGNDFNDHQKLYEKHFTNLNNYLVLKKGKISTKYKNTYIKNNFNMSLRKEEKERIKTEIIYYDDIKDSIIGEVKISLDGIEYFNEKIYIKQKKNDEKDNFWQKLIRKIKAIW